MQVQCHRSMGGDVSPGIAKKQYLVMQWFLFLKFVRGSGKKRDGLIL